MLVAKVFEKTQALAATQGTLSLALALKTIFVRCKICP